MSEYDPQTIEAKWQERWRAERVFDAELDPARPKCYVLEMLPYPSGTLHMGHMRNYSIGDAVARYKRLRGFSVLHPIGWDSFGLPAENAAIERGIHPRRWTHVNILEMKRTCQRFGYSYDWRREISSCEPEYYRWNQWFFLRMLERGLAYRKRSRVNWCPRCQTVLANEQVVNGCCWRHSNSPVEARDIEQWFLRITAYADALLDDMDALAEGWPERVLVMQRNWIGKSRGARVRFPVEGTPPIEVFTTRLDTIYGATAVILAPDHPLVEALLAGQPEEARLRAELTRLRQHVLKAEDLATAEKEGFFTGRHAVNPFTQDLVPLWVANFVLLEYGAGAVMCVPAHDQRDFEFAQKYGITIRVVIQPLDGQPVAAETMPQAFVDYGRLVNSGPYSGLTSEQAIERMTADAQARGVGQAETAYRLKDWGISRQRYWGTPIPVVYCHACGIVPVPDDQLPVRLPEKVELTGMGRSPLASVPEFINTSCPRCGRAAQRETDTMDTFVDSSWYFYRYCDPHNDRAPFAPDVIRGWFPIDHYIGGIEHAILHLIYSRFFCKVMRDLGLVSHKEPVQRLFSQGMVHKGGCVMSKSRGNVVGAMQMAEQYGCDTARLYILFAAQPEKDLEWNDQGVNGCWRFLQRVYRLVARHAERVRTVGVANPHRLDLNTATPKEKAILRKTHQTVRRITHEFEQRWHFNTSIALLMELANELYAQEPLEDAVRPEVVKEALERMALLLAPFAPHLAEELWEMLGHRGGLAAARWPDYDPELAREEQLEVVVQVNGKLRGRILVEAGLGEQELVARALGDAHVAEHIRGKAVRRTVVVPDKLVNLVVG